MTKDCKDTIRQAGSEILRMRARINDLEMQCEGKQYVINALIEHFNLTINDVEDILNEGE